MNDADGIWQPRRCSAPYVRVARSVSATLNVPLVLQRSVGDDMSFESVWTDLQEACRTLSPDAVLVTPGGRAFAISEVGEHRIDIEYREPHEDRTLWRDQFAVLCDRILPEANGLSLNELPPGVHPYVSVLSLSDSYAVDEATNTLRWVEGQEGEESPFIREEWEVRTPHERLQDDTLLLADYIGRYDFSDPEAVPTPFTVDLYVLLSDVGSEADRLRRTVGDSLLDLIGPDARLHGRLGTVHRTRRERRRLKDTAHVFDVLDSQGIPREWVMGVDRDKLDVVIAVTDVETEDVYHIEEQVYVQKVAVEEEEKQSRLQGIKDRLATLESEEADELRHEIQHLEDRLNELLAPS